MICSSHSGADHDSSLLVYDAVQTCIYGCNVYEEWKGYVVKHNSVN